MEGAKQPVLVTCNRWQPTLARATNSQARGSMWAPLWHQPTNEQEETRWLPKAGHFCLPKKFAVQCCCDDYRGYDSCYPQSHCVQPAVSFNYHCLCLPIPTQAVWGLLTVLLPLKENLYTSASLCVCGLQTERDREKEGVLVMPGGSSRFLNWSSFPFCVARRRERRTLRERQRDIEWESEWVSERKRERERDQIQDTNIILD